MTVSVLEVYMRFASLAVFAAVLLSLGGCAGGGGSDGGDTPGPSPSPTPSASPSPSPSPTAPAAATITIQGMAFSPVSLQVAPGAVVTVRNLDGMAHSVTSQTAAGAYVPGAVAGVSFDTGAFVGTATFTIPANAAIGTVVPYYCSTHGSTMATPNGELRIVASPAPPSGTTPPEDPPPGYGT